jgi:hypothetical protein
MDFLPPFPVDDDDSARQSGPNDCRDERGTRAFFGAIVLAAIFTLIAFDLFSYAFLGIGWFGICLG